MVLFLPLLFRALFHLSTPHFPSLNTFCLSVTSLPLHRGEEIRLDSQTLKCNDLKDLAFLKSPDGQPFTAKGLSAHGGIFVTMSHSEGCLWRGAEFGHLCKS